MIFVFVTLKWIYPVPFGFTWNSGRLHPSTTPSLSLFFYKTESSVQQWCLIYALMVQQCDEIANKCSQTLNWNVNFAWLYCYTILSLSLSNNHKASVCGCLSLCVSPEMNWRRVQGVPCLCPMSAGIGQVVEDDWMSYMVHNIAIIYIWSLKT